MSRDGCALQYTYISHITEGGVADRDGRLKVGDRLITVTVCTLFTFVSISMPSVLGLCRMGIRKSIRPVMKLSDEVLLWLSVWSKVQIVYIWSS